MDAPSDLDRQLAALKGTVADAFPPPATDEAVAAAVARAQRKSARGRPASRNGDRWLAWPLALAASIAVLSLIVRSLPPEAVMAEPAAPFAQTRGDEFMALVPLADLESVG